MNSLIFVWLCTIGLVILVVRNARKASLLEIASLAAMLIGSCYAYAVRNSHEGIGMYGVFLAVLGLYAHLQGPSTGKDERKL